MIAEQAEISSRDGYRGKSGFAEYNNLAWGAVLAGASMSLAYAFLLDILGIGLGIATFDVANSSAFKIGTISFIWLVVCGIISMGAGGWFAGKFSNSDCRLRRALHGLLSWGVAVLFSILITASGIGGILGGVVSMKKNTNSLSISQNSDFKALSNKNTYSSGANQGLNDGSNHSDTSSVEQSVAQKSLGTASILVFIAFIISSLASALGAIMSGTFNMRKSDTIE